MVFLVQRIWRHSRSGSGAKICVRAFFETILSKMSSCQKEIYSENLNDISFFFGSYPLHYLQSIGFQMFFSKHSITFENTYLLTCWFHSVVMFYIESKFCKTFTITNSVTRILLIEALYKFRAIKCWFMIYLHMYVVQY